MSARRRRRKSIWLRKSRAGIGCLVVVAAVVFVVVVSIALPVSIVAYRAELRALAYDGFIRPVVQVESTLIGFDPVRRIGLFGLWLGLIFAMGWGLARFLGRRCPSDSVPLVFLWSIVSVATAFSLSSWLMYAILLTLGYRATLE